MNKHHDGTKEKRRKDKEKGKCKENNVTKRGVKNTINEGEKIRKLGN